MAAANDGKEEEEEEVEEEAEEAEEEERDDEDDEDDAEDEDGVPVDAFDDTAAGAMVPANAGNCASPKSCPRTAADMGVAVVAAADAGAEASTAAGAANTGLGL